MELSKRRFVEEVQLLEKSDRISNGAVPLAAGTSYTGPKLECKHWGWIIGTCFADQNGQLRCQFSEDNGEHWDGEHGQIPYKAGDRLVFAFEAVGELARLIFENGNQDQEVFRLFTQLKRGL